MYLITHVLNPVQYTCMVFPQWANYISSLTTNTCMHGVILLASFVESGVKVHESEVTFVEQNLTQVAE